MTNLDLRNLAQFTLHQKRIYRRNRLLQKASHIGSHTITCVWRCTDEYVYKDPISLDPQFEQTYEKTEGVKHDEWLRATRDVAEMAIVTQWLFNETGCNTISCNPFYPDKGVCKGFHETTANKKEAPFSFTTHHDQQIDACQPICYDKDQTKDTYIGMMSLYAHKNHMCYVTDPELMAFYLDPQRRVSDEKQQIVENSAFKIGLQYVGPNGVPAMVAKIDKDYCKQYGLDYVEEKDETISYEEGNKTFGSCTVDKSEGGLTALSTWGGNTLTRAFNFGKEALFNAIEETSKNEKETDALPRKGPASVEYLTSYKAWRLNVDNTKKILPFPLRLTDLGLNEANDGLMWTDEYSFMEDGRNDMYGGRLVERPRGIGRPIWSIIESVHSVPTEAKARAKRSTTEINVQPNRGQCDNAIESKTTSNATESCNGQHETKPLVENITNAHRSENDFLKSLNASVNEYKSQVSTLRGLKATLAGSSFEVMVDQMTAGAAVETLGDLFKQFDDKAAQSGLLKRAIKTTIKRLGGTLSTKSVGLAVTQTVVRTGIEKRAVTFSSNLFKLSFRAISRGSNILSLITLLGTAIDILSAFVYNPYHRYENYMSDRLLYALAQAELVTTQRLIGRQRLLLEPSDWMVNTRYLDQVSDSTYDLFLGMVYTRARRVNSDGSILYWYNYGGVGRDTSGELNYFNQTDNTVSHNALIGNAFDKTRVESETPPEHLFRNSDTNGSTVHVLENRLVEWHTTFAFIIIAAIAFTGLALVTTVYRMFAFAILATIVSVTLTSQSNKSAVST